MLALPSHFDIEIKPRNNRFVCLFLNARPQAGMDMKEMVHAGGGRIVFLLHFRPNKDPEHYGVGMI